MICLHCGFPIEYALGQCRRCGAPVMAVAPSPPQGLPPLPYRHHGNSKIAVILAICAIGSLLMAGAGYWAWTLVHRNLPEEVTVRKPAKLYVLPYLDRKIIGTGFMAGLGAEFLVPVTLVTDNLEERIPFSAGWQYKVRGKNIKGREFTHDDCDMLVRDSGELLWFHRDGRIVEKPVSIPKACDGSLLPATPVTGPKTCGYVDSATLKFRIPPSFEGCGSFLQGLAGVVKNGKSGYIDRSGSFVIPPKFEFCYGFSEDRAAVVLPDGAGLALVDPSGNITPTPKYTEIGAFREGLALARIGSPAKYGFIDKQGNLAIPATFEGIDSSFEDGRAFVRVGGELLLIDKSGTTIAKWNNNATAWPFSEGRARVNHDWVWDMVDTNGKTITQVTSEGLGDYSFGYAVGVNGTNTRLFNREGKVVFGVFLGGIGPFGGRYASVRYSGHSVMNLVDLTGKAVLRVDGGRLIRDPKPWIPN